MVIESVCSTTLLNDVGPCNMTMACWEFSLNLSLPCATFSRIPLLCSKDPQYKSWTLSIVMSLIFRLSIHVLPTMLNSECGVISQMWRHSPVSLKHMPLWCLSIDPYWSTQRSIKRSNRTTHAYLSATPPIPFSMPSTFSHDHPYDLLHRRGLKRE
jgi:hypothetical protein